MYEDPDDLGITLLHGSMERVGVLAKIPLFLLVDIRQSAAFALTKKTENKKYLVPKKKRKTT